MSTLRDAASTACQWALVLNPSDQSFYQRVMFMVSAESKMLWAVADTLNQDFKASPLIGNERVEQARFNLTETKGEPCEIRVPNTDYTHRMEEIPCLKLLL